MKLQSTKAALEFKHDAILGEGPVWDDRKELLYWVDIIGGKIFSYNPKSQKNTFFNVEEHVGAVTCREEEGLVAALQSGFAFFDLSTQKITKIEDPEAHLKNNRFNDGKCDPAGRFWAGTMAYDSAKGAGNLYCLNTDLSVEKKISYVSCSNGLAWNTECNKLFYIDTYTFKVVSFDYDQKTGEISNQSIIRRIDKSEGFPDGMTIDREDHLWVAMYGGSKVIRVNPEDGSTVFEIHLPVPQVTSCTFGGSDFNKLYITTCRENMTDEELERAPLSGSLFKAVLPFTGIPASRFGA